MEIDMENICIPDDRSRCVSICFEKCLSELTLGRPDFKNFNFRALSCTHFQRGVWFSIQLMSEDPPLCKLAAQVQEFP